MNEQVRRMGFLGFLVLALVSVGCGQKTLSLNKTYPTEGTVTHKGEPVRFALVTLEPVGGKGAEGRGATDADGRFKLRTYSNTEADGGVPGEYKVTLEGYNPVKAGALPEGAKPTKITTEMTQAEVTVVIEANEGNELAIVIP